jgi:AbiEi antitoxin C-terminal domain
VTTTNAAAHHRHRQTAGRAADPLVVALSSELSPFLLDSPAEMSRLLAQGLVRRVIADVLVASDAPDSRAVRSAAVALLMPLDARLPLDWVVGFRSAAWLHTGSAGTEQGQSHAASDDLQVIVPPGRRRARASGVRVRQVAVEAEQVMFLGGVPVTTPVRTAADVARDLPAAEALPILHRLGELAAVRPHQVTAMLSTMRYARGAAIARRLVAQWAEER